MLFSRVGRSCSRSSAVGVGGAKHNAKARQYATHQLILSISVARSQRNAFSNISQHKKYQNQMRSGFSSVASSTAKAATPTTTNPTNSDKTSLGISDKCVARLKALAAKKGSDMYLRVMVDSGGCSGFQYTFSLEKEKQQQDRVFEKDGAKVLVDEVSVVVGCCCW